MGEQDVDGPGLPAYLERELRSCLACGLPECGFMLLECDRCQDRCLF